MMLENKTIIPPPNNNYRFDEIDVAKGIGILLVIFFHIHNTGVACDIVYSFHMPLFFFISGFLFVREHHPTIGCFIKKRFKTLMIPYYLFAVGGLLLYIYVNEVHWNGISSAISTDNLKKLLEIFIVRQSSKIRFNTPLWFVPCLFLVEIIYYALSKVKNTPLLVLIVIFLAGIGWYLESDYCFFDSSFLPWNLPSALFALAFYCTGNKIFPYIKRFLLSSKSYIFVLVLVACMAVDIPLALYNGHVTLGSRQLSNGFVFYITGIAGTFGMLSFSKLISKFTPLRWCGKNSFYLMATHKPFLIAYPLLWSKVEKETGLPIYNKENAVECILPFIITVIACSVFTLAYVKLKNIILKKERKI